jgi:hypothetical protein
MNPRICKCPATLSSQPGSVACFAQDGKYDEALAVAKKQVENGAQVGGLIDLF